MRAHVAGVVVERTFKLGSVVKKGKVQFRIDPAPLKADLTQLTRELTALRKALHACGYDGIETVHGIGWRLIGSRDR